MTNICSSPAPDRFTRLKNYANELKKNRLSENSACRRAAWTPARRLAQSQRARALRPSANSTGPRTPTGKAASRNNALKHGSRAGFARSFSSAMAAHGHWLALIGTLSSLGCKRISADPGRTLVALLRIRKLHTRLRAASIRAGIDPDAPFHLAFMQYLGDMPLREHDRIDGRETDS